MKEIEEIVRKLNVVRSSAKECGMEEGVKIYAPVAPNEQEALNILVTRCSDTSISNYTALKASLEEKLGCVVNVTSRELMSEYAYKLREEKIVNVEEEGMESIKKKLGSHVKEAEKIELFKIGTRTSFFPSSIPLRAPNPFTSADEYEHTNLIQSVTQKLPLLSKEYLKELEKQIQEKLESKKQNVV